MKIVNLTQTSNYVCRSQNFYLDSGSLSAALASTALGRVVANGTLRGNRRGSFGSVHGRAVPAP